MSTVDKERDKAKEDKAKEEKEKIQVIVLFSEMRKV